MSARRTAGSQQADVTGRNSVLPTITVARSGPSRRIHGQSGEPKRLAQVRPRLREEVGVQVDDGHLPRQRLGGQRWIRQRPPSGVDPAAARARSRLVVVVEGGERLRQVVDEADQLELAAVHERSALGAVPLEAVGVALRAGSLDDQADRAGHRPLRRVAHVRRQQEHLPLADRDVARRTVVPDAQDHVAAQLVEELVARVVVVVGALVRSADDGDDEVALVPDLGVADRRLQLLAVLLDPAGQVDRLHHRSPRLSWAIALISIARWGCGRAATATVVRAGPLSAAKCCP